MSLQAVQNTEEAIVQSATKALSDAGWEIGRRAAEWERFHSKGRKIEDFAAMIGCDHKTVADRLKVFSVFHLLRDQFPNLRWIHFYFALDFARGEDIECLKWANEMDATPAEMRAWCRAQRGYPLDETEAETKPKRPRKKNPLHGSTDGQVRATADS